MVNSLLANAVEISLNAKNKEEEKAMEKILAKTANIMETIWKEREGRLEIARAKQVSYWNNLEKEIQNLEMAVKPRSQDWQIQNETKKRKFEVDEKEDIATNTEMARIVMELAEMSLEEENPIDQVVAEVCDRIDNMSLTGSAIGNINNNETANLCKKLKLMKISCTENNVLSTKMETRSTLYCPWGKFLSAHNQCSG